MMFASSMVEKGWLHSGFLKSAALFPDAIALSVGNRQCTYAELEDKARRWASCLCNAASGTPQRVGIFAHRGEVAYISILASLFTGAAFVPLNPSFPMTRTRSMMELAALDAIFVEEALLPRVRDIIYGLPNLPVVIQPDADVPKGALPGLRILDRSDVNHALPLSVLPAVPRDSVAYILFTSGSTGQPKGVPITHANVTHFLAMNQRRYAFTPEDRLSQTFDLTFDLSLFDLFMAWGSGACVCLIPPVQMLAPFRSLQEQGITVWFSVPSAAVLLQKRNLLTPGSLPTLRWSLFCGEALPKRTAEAWQAAAPHSVLENLYGPTELTIACAVYRWDPVLSPPECVNGVVPIGQVHDGLRHLVVSETLEPVLPGEAGELVVGGPQTFPGYWRDSEKTAQRLFTCTEPGGQQVLYYRTGDRVRLLESGNYAYLGRVDFQVKVRGYRVELNEVEVALHQEPNVMQAVALGWPIEDGNAQGLVAFVSGCNIDMTALEGRLRDTLPAYMVPRQIYHLETMPLNSNGKIDRNALPPLLETGLSRARTA